MAFPKKGRSDSVRISSGRLLQLFGGKNKNEFVPCCKKVFLGFSQNFKKFVYISAL